MKQGCQHVRLRTMQQLAEAQKALRFLDPAQNGLRSGRGRIDPGHTSRPLSVEKACLIRAYMIRTSTGNRLLLAKPSTGPRREMTSHLNGNMTSHLNGNTVLAFFLFDAGDGVHKCARSRRRSGKRRRRKRATAEGADLHKVDEDHLVCCRGIRRQEAQQQAVSKAWRR